MRNGYPLTDRIMRTHNHRVVSLCLMSVFTLLVARDLHAAERTFCQGEECTPDNFKVRFGNLGEERSTTQALAGEIIELRVTIDVVSEVQGWNFGLSHDTSKLEIIEATSESLGLPETFFYATVISMPDNNGNPSPGLVSGVILAINAQGQEMLTPGDEVMVLTARYRQPAARSWRTKDHYGTDDRGANTPPRKSRRRRSACPKGQQRRNALQSSRL